MSLRALFLGNKEVLTEAQKRKPGRPKTKPTPEGPRRKPGRPKTRPTPEAPKRKLECGHGTRAMRQEDPPFGVRMQRLAHLRGVEASEMRLPRGKARRPQSCEVQETEVLEDIAFIFRLRYLSTMWSLRPMNSSSEGHPERCPDFLRPVANLEAN